MITAVAARNGLWLLMGIFNGHLRVRVYAIRLKFSYNCCTVVQKLHQKCMKIWIVVKIIRNFCACKSCENFESRNENTPGWTGITLHTTTDPLGYSGVSAGYGTVRVLIHLAQHFYRDPEIPVLYDLFHRNSYPIIGSNFPLFFQTRSNAGFGFTFISTSTYLKMFLCVSIGKVDLLLTDHH